MQVEIWSQQTSWLHKFLNPQSTAYHGPYLTTALPLTTPLLLLSSNSSIYVLNLQKLTTVSHIRLSSQILHLHYCKKMVLAVTSTTTELLNQRLERVRSFTVEGKDVYSVTISSRGFVVMYGGLKEVQSFPLVGWRRVERRRELEGYHEGNRLYYQDAKVWLENLENGIKTIIEIEHLPNKCEVFQCRQIGEVVAVTIDRVFTACLSSDEYRYLYTLPQSRNREVIGHYLAEAKGKEIQVRFLNQAGPMKIGVLANGDDHLECLVAVGESFYVVKQILEPTRELRRVEKCDLHLSLSSQNSFGSSLDKQIDQRPTMPAITQKSPLTESCPQVLTSPTFMQPPPSVLRTTHSQPWHRRQYVLCSPIVETETGYNGDMFHTAKDLFLGQIDEDKQEEESICETEKEVVVVEEGKFGSEKEEFFKNSFGNMGGNQGLFGGVNSSFGNAGTNAGGNVNINVNITGNTVVNTSVGGNFSTPRFDAFGSPTSICQLFTPNNLSIQVQTITQYLQKCQPSQTTPTILKKLSLLNPYQLLDLETYKQLIETQPIVLIQQIFSDNKQEAVEAFFVEVIKFQPELCDVVLEKFKGQEEMVRKMEELMRLLPTEVLKKKFKRQCYKYLNQHKLCTIPYDLLLDPLPSPSDLSLLLIFHPQCLLSQLSTPSTLLSTLLHIYFSIPPYPPSQLPVQSVTIQDQQIEITNPRNMLNIIMYFSDVFQLQPAEAIKKYLYVMFEKGEQGLLEIVERIVYQQGVLEICEMRPEMVEEIVKGFERWVYFQRPGAVHGVKGCLEVLVRVDAGYKRKAKCRLAIIEILEPFNTLINFSDVYLIETMKTGCKFMEGLIRDEEPAVLATMGLEDIYENVWMLEEPESENIKLSFYTRQLLNLSEILIQKCVDKRCYTQCLQYLQRIKPRLKLGLLLYCILRYLHNQFRTVSPHRITCYLPRFLSATKQSLFQLFHHLATNSQLQLPQPLIDQQQQQSSFLCSYERMREKLDKWPEPILGAEGSLLPYEVFTKLLYHRSKMVVVLARFDGTVDAEGLKGFLVRMQHQGYFTKIQEKRKKEKEICPELPLVYSVPVLERWSPEPKFKKQDEENNHRKQDTVKRVNSAQYLAVNNSSNSLHLKTQQDSHSQIGTTSFRTNAFPYKKISSMRIRRRQSSPQQSIDDVSEVRKLTDPFQLRSKLQLQYKTKPFPQFLKLIERSKLNLKLHWTDQLLRLDSYGIDFDYRKVVTLQALLEENPQDAFIRIRESILRELTVKSFWIIAYIVQFVLGEEYGRLVALVYLEKHLEGWRDDPNPEETRQRVKIVIEHYGLGWKELEPCLLEAERYGLREFACVLRETKEVKDTRDIRDTREARECRS